MLIPRGIAREGVGHIKASFCRVPDMWFPTPGKRWLKSRHAIERDILHPFTWRGLTVGDHFNFYITGLLIQFTKFNFTCKMLVETISSRCSSDIHRNDVTFIFLSLQNHLTLRAVSPRDSEETSTLQARNLDGKEMQRDITLSRKENSKSFTNGFVGKPSFNKLSYKRLVH